MKRLRNILLVLLGLLLGGLVYDNWDRIGQWAASESSVAGVSKQITGLIEKSASGTADEVFQEPETPITTTVYKWQDQSGQWHVSNTPPEGVADFQTKSYRSDQNVVKSTHTPTLTEEQAQAVEEQAAAVDEQPASADGVFDSYHDAIDDARAARAQSELRNRQLQDRLE